MTDNQEELRRSKKQDNELTDEEIALLEKSRKNYLFNDIDFYRCRYLFNRRK